MVKNKSTFFIDSNEIDIFQENCECDFSSNQIQSFCTFVTISPKQTSKLSENFIFSGIEFSKFLQN